MGDPTEIYRSMSRAACAERAFVLDAIGIASETHIDGPLYLLSVDADDAPRALEQLAQYELERRAPPPAVLPSPPAHAGAWVGCALYAVVLVVVALAVGNGWWRLDAFQLGALEAGKVQAGQWWRAWTALTLHLDGAHLAANLAAGVWFGYLAGRQLGAGHAWLLTLIAAAGANLAESLSAAPSHAAVGASTAVFAALGLLCAHAWGTRARGAPRWALRWAPLVGGVVLLGWLGSGGDEGGGQIDVVGHVLGFLAGLAFGALAARPFPRGLLERTPQWLSGAIALAQIAAAWSWALSR